MTRVIALAIGLILIVLPGWWLVDATVPLPQYRKGSAADYEFLERALLAIYGSVLLGITVQWVRAIRSGQPLIPIEVFKAGMYGVLAVSIVFFGGGIIYGLTKYGAFEKVIGGNLWGIFVIFWAILSAIVAAGLALLCYGWRGPAGHAGAMPGSGGLGMPRS